MEPPSFNAPEKTKRNRPGRRVRKNSKPTDDGSDFFNSNLNQNSQIPGGAQITAPAPAPVVQPQQQSAPQPSFQPSNQGFYQPQQQSNVGFGDQQQPMQPGFVPQQQQQQQQYQQQPQQPQQNMGFMPNMMNMGGPNQNMATGLMANMAMQYGDNLKNQGSAMVDKYLDSKSLKLYFQVDTQYVRKKLSCLILPFLHKDWSQRYAGTTNAPMSPKDDVNVPDLYIPSMALLTYVLLAGIIHGKSGSFDPEELGGTLSFGIGAILLEVLIVNFVTYLLNLRTDMKTYDIISYLGYKFVPVCFLLISILLIPGLYWLLFAGLSAACAFFLYKTLCLKINNPSAAAANEFGGVNQQISKKSYISMGVAALQPLLIYVLTYSF